MGILCYLIHLMEGEEEPDMAREPTTNKATAATALMPTGPLYAPSRPFTPFPESNKGLRQDKLNSVRIKKALDLLLSHYQTGKITETEYLKQADDLIDQLADTLHHEY
ncbi:hypothetical protein [Nibrella saemangeumensis]|uniref:hypothetical protein n=1 Tax=Nibrella saemangeumensis TaxID=1084526 RepID=UPI0031E842E1